MLLAKTVSLESKPYQLGSTLGPIWLHIGFYTTLLNDPRGKAYIPFGLDGGFFNGRSPEAKKGNEDAIQQPSIHVYIYMYPSSPITCIVGS